jgi:hypothetical protein
MACKSITPLGPGSVDVLRILEGLHAYYPGLCDRHSLKANDSSFTWSSFFRDIAYDATLGRFRDYPAKLRQKKASKLHDDTDGEPRPATPAGPLRAVRLGPDVGKDFLDGKGILEVWESLIEDTIKEGR